jgi:hypothetical protein
LICQQQTTTLTRLPGGEPETMRVDSALRNSRHLARRSSTPWPGLAFLDQAARFLPIRFLSMPDFSAAIAYLKTLKGIYFPPFIT